MSRSRLNSDFVIALLPLLFSPLLHASLLMDSMFLELNSWIEMSRVGMLQNYCRCVLKATCIHSPIKFVKPQIIAHLALGLQPPAKKNIKLELPVNPDALFVGPCTCLEGERKEPMVPKSLPMSQMAFLNDF